MPNTNISLSYPEVWSKYMAKNFDAKAVMVPLVNRSVESDIAQEGDTVNVQKWGNVTVNSYTASTDTTITGVALTNDTLVLDQSKYFHFNIDDTEKAMSHLDLIKGFTERGMIAMGQTIDDRLFTHYADFDSGNRVGSAAAPITVTADNVYDYFVQMGQILDEDNIPESERVAVVDPGTKAAILRSPDFVKATAKGDSVVEKAMIGDLAGFKVVVSNRITTVTNSKPLMFFHPEAISFAMRIDPNKVKMYEPEKQFGKNVKALAHYGSKVFNSTAGAVLFKAA